MYSICAIAILHKFLPNSVTKLVRNYHDRNLAGSLFALHSPLTVSIINETNSQVAKLDF